MFKVFITSIIPELAIEKLKTNKIEVIQNFSYDSIKKNDLMKLAKDCDAIISLLSDKIDAEVINSLSNLKIIANYAVGYNNIDYKLAMKKNIWVTNTPNVLTNATADLAMVLLLGCSRRIIEADKFTREGKFRNWQSDLFLGKEINGKTIGVIGLGRIGKAFVERLSGFGLNILYYDLKRDLEYEKKYRIKYQNLDSLISNSDFISIHIPLTEKTKHLFNEERFSLLKPGVIIINTARGEIIKEKLLLKYLKNGIVYSAGLDVYEFEPKITKELLKLKNVICLPHIGSATTETRNKMAEIVTDNVIAVSMGKNPKNNVNQYFS